MMEPEVSLIRSHLKTPRAGTIAGIVFSTLRITSLVLLRITVPANPLKAGSRLSGGWKKVSPALNLLPFAGIAFLGFIGVLRDRIGAFFWVRCNDEGCSATQYPDFLQRHQYQYLTIPLPG